MQYSDSRLRGASRVGASVASFGVLAAASMIGASAANAADDVDCDPTITASTNGGLQTLLDANEPLVCVQGSVPITNTLIFYNDLVLHGLPGAVLDGGGTTQILKRFDLADTTTLTVENLRFTGGNSGGLVDGGAIDAYSIFVYNSQFDDNRGGNGGAIAAYSAEIEDSVFFDNEASDNGGAVYTLFAVFTDRTTYHHNQASLRGGAIYSEDYSSIDSSTFNNNSATNGGAAVGLGYFEMQNSTLVANQVSPVNGSGGAVLSEGSGLLLHNTFLDNTASLGAGNAVSYLGNSAFEVRANIFAGTSTAPQLSAANVPIIDLNGNVFTTATEPALAAVQPTTALGIPLALIFGGNGLASNGGPTQTVALPDGSFAIDFVPVGTPLVTVDQRGVARSALSDAGAYEHENPASAAIAATGSEPAWWLAGVAGVLVLGGALAAVLGRVASRRGSGRRASARGTRSQ